MPDVSGARAIMRTGSRSFSLAAWFFGEEQRAAAEMLYRWCRYCDDQIDAAPSRELAASAQASLRARLAAPAADAEFAALESVLQRHRIPRQYPGDLLDGLAMDVDFEPIRNQAHLELYAYRVAGVVGLMMAHVMGVSDERALDHAVDLGIAMQMTNIARDVAEDFARGRVYLPADWLASEGVDPAALTAPEQSAAAYRVVQRLLAEADRRYASGYAGLAHLPLRCALTISVAGSVYSAIGHELLKKGPAALKGRTVVKRWKQIWRAALGLGRILPLAASRTVLPWRPVRIARVYRKTA